MCLRLGTHEADEKQNPSTMRIRFYMGKGENMRVTKYVVTSPECTNILPSDISTMIYESNKGVKVKETCFGAIIEGEEQLIKSLVEEIRALDPSGIFIKDRGFPLGDPRRCRGVDSESPCKLVWLTSGKRSGSVRPGCYMIEAESKMLPQISRALASMAKVESEMDMMSKPIGNRPCKR